MTLPADLSISPAQEWSLHTDDAKGSGAANTAPDKVSLLLEELIPEVTALYTQHASALKGFAYCLCGNVEIAREAVQEAFLRYHASRLTGQLKEGGKAWLFRTTHNYVLDRVKESFLTKSVCIEQASGHADRTQDPSSHYARKQLAQLILSMLTPRERQCLQLRAEGFKYREIAVILGIDLGTVGAIMARGLNKVREAVGQGGKK
jgi:RNA polymerase sigma-70 factor, ECF subfamily